MCLRSSGTDTHVAAIKLSKAITAHETSDIRDMRAFTFTLCISTTPDLHTYINHGAAGEGLVPHLTSPGLVGPGDKGLHGIHAELALWVPVVVNPGEAPVNL